MNNLTNYPLLVFALAFFGLWLSARIGSSFLKRQRKPDNDDRYLVHDGDASDPKAWDGLLQAIGRVERFNVHIPHADKLRHMWSEWLVVQERLRRERGW
jgi:hypothetical protein